MQACTHPGLLLHQVVRVEARQACSEHIRVIVKQPGQTEGGRDQHAYAAGKQVRQLLRLLSGRLEGDVVDAAEQPAQVQKCRVGRPPLGRPLKRLKERSSLELLELESEFG